MGLADAIRAGKGLESYRCGKSCAENAILHGGAGGVKFLPLLLLSPQRTRRHGDTELQSSAGPQARGATGCLSAS